MVVDDLDPEFVSTEVDVPPVDDSVVLIEVDVPPVYLPLVDDSGPRTVRIPA